MQIFNLKIIYSVLIVSSLLTCSDVKKNNDKNLEVSINDYLIIAKNIIKKNHNKYDSIIYCDNFNFKEFTYRNKITNNANINNYSIVRYFGGKIKNVEVISKNKFNVSVIVCDCTNYKILIPEKMGDFDDKKTKSSGFVVLKNKMLIYFNTVGYVLGESPLYTLTTSNSIMLLEEDLYPNYFFRLNGRGQILYLSKFIYDSNRKMINTNILFFSEDNQMVKYRSIDFKRNTFEFILESARYHDFRLSGINVLPDIERYDFPLWYNSVWLDKGR